MTLEDGSLLEIGDFAANLGHDAWVIGPEALVKSFDFETEIWGDPDDSSITLAGSNAELTSQGGLRVAYLIANPGSRVEAFDHYQPFRRGVLNGASLWTGRVTIGGAAADPPFPSLELQGASTAEASFLGILARGTLRYGHGANSLVTLGDFLVDAADALVQPEQNGGTGSLALTFGGAYRVQTDADHFSGWDASGVTLYGGGGAAEGLLEVTYGDFGGLFFVDVACVPYSGLVVRTAEPGNPPSGLTLLDAHDNAFHGSPPATDAEALYINGDVTVEPYATLKLNGINVYYTGTLTIQAEGQIIRYGDEDIYQVRGLNYGDFDEDCDVDLADYLIFQQHYTGSGGETDWPPADGDCDKDVDQAVYLKFQLNFTGSLPGCDSGEGGNAPSGGGGDERFTGSLEELAGWSWYHLTDRQRLRLAERLELVVRTGQGGDQADQIADLARMLR